MKILLLGYGKMGKAIEKVALERKHEIVGKINAENAETLQNFDAQNTDVAIEFSQPDVAYQNIKYCLKKNIPVVSGTTGWIDKIQELENYCKAEKATFFYASNFSIAVNMLFIINEKLAQLMSNYADYDVKMKEIHHIHKKDEPSGTAITLAQGIIDNHSQKENWIAAQTGGILNTNYSLGQVIKKGEILGKITDPFGTGSKENVRAPKDGIIVGINTTPLVHEGMPLFKVASFVDYDRAETAIEAWDKQQDTSFLD